MKKFFSRIGRSRNSRLAVVSVFILAAAGTVSSALQGSSKSRPKQQTPPAPSSRLPELGDEVPAALLKQATTAKPCETGEGRHEPCATMTLRSADSTDRFTIAWDATLKHITYLYSTTLITDDDIRTGDVLRD